MKKRLLYDALIKQIQHKNTLVITGMRQIGKTTLMRQLFDAETSRHKLWFDLDNPLDQKIFESTDYRAIHERLVAMAGSAGRPLFVCIDEIQNHPQITKVIKYLMDHFGVKFIVTGSSSFYLKNLFPESLAGRKFLYELTPLRFREFLYFHDAIARDAAQRPALDTFLRLPSDSVLPHQREALYEQYLAFGGFPEVVLTPDTETKKLILKNIFAGFFEKDLHILSDYKDIRELRDILILLVPRVGSMLDITKLAGELGVERAKIYGYLAFLEKTFFISLIPKYSMSVDRVVAGGKKLYFSDTGILTTIGPVNMGQLVENAVINDLREYGPVSFYNKRNSAKIDAIVDGKAAIEIKLAGSPKDSDKLDRLASSIHVRQTLVVSRKIINHPGIISPTLI
ncbi:ATP-binding protein [Candidatus Gottesmanbacteria bacterium]|nr:ATP-binding protein [Candidatus Gottesmanbacteria bacterium]